MIQQPPGLKRLFLHVHTLEWNEVFPMPELSVLTFLIVCPLLFLAGLVDAVSSDAHNCTSRPTRMRQAYERLCTRVGQTTAQKLTGLDGTEYLV